MRAISDAARAADRDVQVFTGTPYPVRDFEAVFEMTYLAEIQSGWTVQPVFQYVFHPGGGIVDPNDPTQTQRIKDAAVFWSSKHFQLLRAAVIGL